MLFIDVVSSHAEADSDRRSGEGCTHSSKPLSGRWDGPGGFAGYAASQRYRKRIEECFGWAKTIGGLRKSRFVGRDKLDFQFVLTMAAYNLVRMRNLGVVSC